jgi:hypothetical protein
MRRAALALHGEATRMRKPSIVLSFLLAACGDQTGPATFADETETIASSKSSELRSANFFESFPQDQRYTLSTGEVVALPTHFYKTEGLNIIGTVDADFASSVVPAERFDLVHVWPSRVLAIVTIFVTTEHDFGPHNDFGVNIMVKPKFESNDDRGPSVLLTTQAVSWKFFGDLEISNQADREIWGLDKEFSTITASTTSSTRTFAFSNDDGPWGSVAFDLPSFALPLPTSLKTVLYPSGAPEKEAPIFHHGKIQTLVGGGHGTVTFDSHHPIGRAMNDMQFKPLVWQYGPELKAAYLPPQGL